MGYELLLNKFGAYASTFRAGVAWLFNTLLSGGLIELPELSDGQYVVKVQLDEDIVLSETITIMQK